ncbi:MAG TPA: hypothetical protein EYG89_05255 [Bacteroidia bacterium]|nr:hypothetical protein [Bacteroidia bacterium]
MTKTYYKKENILVWYFLLALTIGLIIFGYVLIRYFVWQVLPLIIMILSKIFKLSKNNTSPIIELNNTGIKILNPVLGDQFYPYTDISKIHLNSKTLNGYIKLKSKKKKIRIDSVAIDINDQKEISTFINNKIFI